MQEKANDHFPWGVHAAISFELNRPISACLTVAQGKGDQRSMEKIRTTLLGLSRRQKRALQVSFDVVLIWGSLWLAFLVRLGIEDLSDPVEQYPWLFIAAPVIAIPLFIRAGLYRAVMRYFGTDALITIIKSVSLSSLILALVVFWNGNRYPSVPRTVVFNYWWLSLIMVGGLRLIVRQYFLGDWSVAAHYGPFANRDEALPRVAIYGAGAAGNQLVVALRMGRAMRPVAFIDDDDSISGRVILGLQVFKPRNIQGLIEQTGAEEILLAIPSASRARRREILTELEQYSIHVRTIPGFMDLASGRVKIDDVQEVDIAELLGRDPVPAQDELLERCIGGKVVLVTGAGGSIGSELCRQIVELKPQILLLFDHSEFNLYNIHSELKLRVARGSSPVRILPILGSIRNNTQLLDVMRNWQVDTVYHAAAYKHVPMVEYNIAEGVLNNVLGTLNTAQAALEAGVANFVLISTDKAVRPTNVMGASKRLAEMILQGLSREASPILFGNNPGTAHVNNTRYTMVRFGNVLGSSGSVIPLFHKQIKMGGPLTVTHPKITRYFMTIPEAAQLVIQAGSMGLGGDVFVLDMGEPVKIIELAEKMVHLSGLTVRSDADPGGDISIEFTGLRPGEKLYEELLIGDDVAPTQHRMIMSANEAFLPWEALKSALAEMLSAIASGDLLRVNEVMRETVIGYKPEGEIVDLFFLQSRASN
jgi:UDP-N-acetylglucosamine 4,6-dehydratase